MDRNIVRNILLRIDKIKVGESLLIEDLANEFPNISLSDILNIVAKLSARYYIRIDGKYSHESYSIEKYNKILGLDRDGLDAVDYIRNDKIWQKLETALTQNGYADFSIFTAVEFSKQILKKEFEDILGK